MSGPGIERLVKRFHFAMAILLVATTIGPPAPLARSADLTAGVSGRNGPSATTTGLAQPRDLYPPPAEFAAYSLGLASFGYVRT